MAKYLILGGGGTLGSEFKQLLPSEIILSPNRSELDLSEPANISSFFKEHRPEVVINCAAYTNVDQAETDSLNYTINAKLPEWLSQECRKLNSILVHFSTGMVFSGDDPKGHNEESPTNPINKYGSAKLAGEKSIQENLVSYYIIRTEWLYGKPSNNSAKKSFIDIMIELGRSGYVKGVADEFGQPTWARDIAKAVLGMLETKPSYGIYHLANEGRASRMEWAQEIFKILAMDVAIEPVPASSFQRTAERPKYELLNNNKLAKLRPWQEALKEYLTQD